MRLMVASKVGTDTLRHFLSSKQAGRLNDIAFAMNPVWLNAIEPGTLAGQVEGDDAHSLALLPNLTIVCVEPGPHWLADVPGGIVPDQDQSRFALLFQFFAAPGQVLRRDGTQRSVLDE